MRERGRRFAALIVALLIVGPTAIGAADRSPARPSTGKRTDTARCATTPDPSTAHAVRAPIGTGDGPEVATGFVGKDAVVADTVMAVTANPIASRVACEILVAGGSAIDATIAAQMVLNLVEPQSSGLGGGALMLYYDAKTRAVESYDGRETAPAAAAENDLRYVDDATNRTTPRPNVRASGRSIGTPGVLRMLELAHREHGRMPWSSLFDPAIALSTRGFRISPRMSASIAGSRSGLARDPGAAAYFLAADGSAKPAGTLLTNPALAETLATIARGGADAFYTGDLAQAVVDRIVDPRDGATPGRTTLADLANYRAKHRDPVCAPYRAYIVCGMGPPSSGGIAVASALGILEQFDLAAHPPKRIGRDGGRPDVLAVHLIAEAERLAYADRDKYVADTDFVPLPPGGVGALLDPNYLRSRARSISLDRSMGRAQAGNFGPVPMGIDATREHGTTQLTIADRDGNVVSMTTTVEAAFGSFHFVRGFVLNNELTDFSFEPTDAAGAPIANRVAPGKRPRSAMCPTLVFRRNADGGRGDFVLATGSGGGFVIIQYVVKSLVAALDWGLDPQQAVSMIDFGAANSPTTYVGGEHPDVDASDNGAHDPLVVGLRALGHTVSVAPHSSALTMLRRTLVNGRPGWIGGADPRREGVAVGDAPASGRSR